MPLQQGEGAGVTSGASAMIMPGLPPGRVRVRLDGRHALCGGGPHVGMLHAGRVSGPQRAVQTSNLGWLRPPVAVARGGQAALWLHRSGGKGPDEGSARGSSARGPYVAFPKLSDSNTVTKLLDAVAPFLVEDGNGAVILSGRNAAHVMNKLKSLRKSKAYGNEAAAEMKRADTVRAHLVQIVTSKVNELGLKHLALALNAVKGSRGAPEAGLVEAVCGRVIELLRDEERLADEGISPSVPAQTVAMLVNALAMGAGGFSAAKHAPDAQGPAAPSRLAPSPDSQTAGQVAQVFEISTRVLLAMPPAAFDAQSISTTINAYASAGLWHVALFRRLGSLAVALPPQHLTLQPVAMVVNAYSRLMEQVSSWR